MRRQINPKFLVSTWEPKKNKEKASEEEKTHEDGKPAKIIMNNGWNKFYQKHRVKMKIKDFAIETGIHPYTISRWDKGVGSPNFRLLFIFLEYVADRDKKPITKVFDELYDFVEKYGTEEKK